MHSSRMHTARRGGSPPGIPQDQTPPGPGAHPDQAPPLWTISNNNTKMIKNTKMQTHSMKSITLDQ